MEPKISILIPVYNTAALLPRCLKSVTEQSLREIEIICVDDGSTDSSYEVLQEWARKDSRIVVLQQANGRQGKARNTALAVARGEYVGMVDSDDYIPADYFERLYDAAQRHKADIAVCGITKEKKQSDKIIVSYSEEVVEHRADAKLRLCNCPPDFYVYNKLYRRDMLCERALRFDEGVQFEDVVFVMRAVCESGRMVTVPGPAYRYVLNQGSTINSRQTAAKQLQKYMAHKAMVDYAALHGISIPVKYKNITVKHFSLAGICLWKIKEKGSVRTLRLFDFLPVWRYKK